jgi:hypothetical protein
MTRFGSAAALAALFVFASSAAFAQLRVLTEGEADIRSVLPAPPKDGSAEAKAEIAELHKIIAEATDERKAQAKADDGSQNMSIYTDVFGVELASIPSVKAVLDDVENDRKIAVDRAKAHFKRKRPSAVDSGIKPCGEIRDMLSGYPSAAASYAYASGNTLVAMFPRMANEILERSSSFAESRLVCGMHFRSDIMAGQYAGTAIADRMLAHPDFTARVDAAAEDLREAMK